MEVLDVLASARALLDKGWSPFEAERRTSWIKNQWDQCDPYDWRAERFSLGGALKRAGIGDHLARKLAQIAVAKTILEMHDGKMEGANVPLWSDQVILWFDQWCHAQGEALRIIERTIAREQPSAKLLDDFIPY